MAIELLTNKSSKERATIKSSEISKLIFSGEYTKDNIKIEIIGDVKEINIKGHSGIEVFSKGWKNGKQLGFGDGTIEIEHFKIFNPPILVDDPNGNIIRTWTSPDGKTLGQIKLREDPLEAVRQVIADNIRIMGKESEKIILGKIGNTTSTFYPDASPETTSVDGYAGEAGAVYATVRNASGGASSDSATILAAQYALNAGTYVMYRSAVLFDTSALPDGDTISSATLTITPDSIVDGNNDSISLVPSNPQSNTAVVNSDFDITRWTTTLQATSIDITSLSVGTGADFTLNATGISNISKTSITKFGLRLLADINDTTPTVNALVFPRSADYAGTTSDPKLVVVHSASTNTTNFFF